MSCCNHQCREGRECKRRETRDVTAWVLFAAILAAAIAAAAAVVSLPKGIL